MLAIKGHFDGKVIVPDEPVSLPLDEALVIHIQRAAQSPSATAEHLAISPLVGIWRDRGDITDSPDFARRLRSAAQRR